ncbi:uncharacterized protein LOC117782047 isoform X2 [Drosophila innubila]|uniref:uncharacterized protein LOC117782047 isoform X2 n=1 Tax=Drosophila innubila TaxID=198719 RepID=UPI00148D2806|nr:uncharacterized protein LOC117782047 isoform X2 [Drosophila innubila]XP_034474855.1 uncharacterized protein LOC117782047 isoform X2 [Drosophila innubila]XP_034474856.1 uncharacterized protein LOC117782047 isoform X2 [Drosophila innubila]
MPWLTTLLAALMLHCVVAGNRFAAYDELTSPVLAGNPPKRCSRFLGDCPEQLETLQSGAIDSDAGTSKMLNALFGLVQSTQTPTHPTEAALTPYQLPPMYYNDFYEDLLTNKRNDVHSAGCDCKVKNDLMDLGSAHFPRYLMSAICESRPALDAKCTRGSNCKPLEYKIKVLTLGTDQTSPKAATSSASLSRPWLTEELTQPWQWQFRTVTVTAGCFCTN